MKIAIIGTGMVGRGLAARLAGLGHDVVIGTRDVDVTLARTTPDGMGTPPCGVRVMVTATGTPLTNTELVRRNRNPR